VGPVHAARHEGLAAAAALAVVFEEPDGAAGPSAAIRWGGDVEQDRVVVIGGGVIGVTSAYYLAQEGFAVTLLDKGEVCSGSSHGNAGLIVPSHIVPLAAPGVWWQGVKWMLDPESPFYIKPRLDLELARWLWRFRAACTEARMRQAIPLLRRLTVESLRLYREFAERGEFDFGFRQPGSMTVFFTEEGLAHGRAEARLAAEFGVPIEVLDGAAARAAEPALRPGVAGALFGREDALLVPDRFVKGVARLAAAAGVRVATGSEVLGFQTRGDRLTAVETTRGPVAADTVVLAAGAWSPAIGRTLGLRVPIQPAKGYSLTFRRPARGPNIPLLPAEGRFSVTPMGEFLRFGGTLELAGMDLSINRRRVDALRRKALACLEGVDGLELLEIWRGLRPCTPDGLPLVGRSRRFANLVLAAGHAMVGMSLGPVTGKLVTQLVQDKPPWTDIQPLDPDRFR
jgi:D-amino-acid dehydrogenase